MCEGDEGVSIVGEDVCVDLGIVVEGGVLECGVELVEIVYVVMDGVGDIVLCGKVVDFCFEIE